MPQDARGTLQAQKKFSAQKHKRSLAPPRLQLTLHVCSTNLGSDNERYSTDSSRYVRSPPSSGSDSPTSLVLLISTISLVISQVSAFLVSPIRHMGPPQLSLHRSSRCERKRAAPAGDPFIRYRSYPKKKKRKKKSRNIFFPQGIKSGRATIFSVPAHRSIRLRCETRYLTELHPGCQKRRKRRALQPPMAWRFLQASGLNLVMIRHVPDPCRELASPSAKAMQDTPSRRPHPLPRLPIHSLALTPRPPMQTAGDWLSRLGAL